MLTNIQKQIFLKMFFQLSLSLSELLNTQFVPHKGIGGIVGQQLRDLLCMYNRGQYNLLCYNTTLVSLLVDELNEIKKFDQTLIKKFQKNYANGKYDQYFGFRMEVSSAAVFIKKGIHFKKEESPDYTIFLSEQDKVFVECTSSHIKANHDNLFKKIISPIRVKLEKSYLNNRTALFIDITNIMHQMEKRSVLMEQIDIEKLVKCEMHNKNIGAVYLFFYAVDKDKDFIANHLIRILNNNIDEFLLNFLNKNFPEGTDIMSNYVIPSMG